MITNYTTRYGVALGGRAVRHRFGSNDLPVTGWFWKMSGAIVLAATVLAFIGSCWFSWTLRKGLEDLAAEQARKQELNKQYASLLVRKDDLFARSRIEGLAADRLALYPTTQKDLGGGLVVKVPNK